MKLPSAEQINPFKCLDGNTAEKHFLGKSIDEVVTMFEVSFETYQEDLMFMGPMAFKFYWEAIELYVRSDKSKTDWSVINYLKSSISCQIEDNEIELHSIFPRIESLTNYVIENFKKFYDSTENSMSEEENSMNKDIYNEWLDLQKKFI